MAKFPNHCTKLMLNNFFLQSAFGKKHDNCTTSSSTSENRASCSFFLPRITIPDNYTIEVEAENGDGIIKSDMTCWRLEDIGKCYLIFLYTLY